MATGGHGGFRNPNWIPWPLFLSLLSVSWTVSRPESRWFTSTGLRANDVRGLTQDWSDISFCSSCRNYARTHTLTILGWIPFFSLVVLKNKTEMWLKHIWWSEHCWYHVMLGWCGVLVDALLNIHLKTTTTILWWIYCSISAEYIVVSQCLLTSIHWAWENATLFIQRRLMASHV